MVIFLHLKMCWNTYFFVFLNIDQNLAQKGTKNDNFSHFAKHRLLEKPFCCNPPFDQKLARFQLVFFETKNIDVEQKHNWKSGKTKIKKGLERKKQDRKPKKDTGLIKKKLCNSIFWCCSFSQNKSKDNRKKKKRKIRNQKKTKRKDKKEERKKRARERQRKRNWTSGRPKEAQEKQRETLKNKQKCPFLGGKLFFTQKQRKERKNNQKKKQKNKQGGFRAKWGGPSGHLTWPLTPPKKAQANKPPKKQTKKRRRA